VRGERRNPADVFRSVLPLAISQNAVEAAVPSAISSRRAIDGRAFLMLAKIHGGMHRILQHVGWLCDVSLIAIASYGMLRESPPEDGALPRKGHVGGNRPRDQAVAALLARFDRVLAPPPSSECPIAELRLSGWTGVEMQSKAELMQACRRESTEYAGAASSGPLDITNSVPKRLAEQRPLMTEDLERREDRR
jgi:hypothetical protein